MATENIEIVVRDTGAERAATNLLNVANAADKTAKAEARLSAENQRVAASLTRAQAGTISAAAGFDKAQAAAIRAATALSKAQQAAIAASAGMTKAGTASAAMATGIGRVADKTTAAQSALGGFRAVIATLGIGMAARQVLEWSDSYTALINRLALVSKNAKDLVEKEKSLFEMSQKTYSSYSNTVGLYTRLAMTSATLGNNHTKLLSVVKSVNMAFVLSGANAAEAAGATLQLAQALGSGFLRGQEFNAVAEQAPLILIAIAAETGKTAGALKDLAAEGQITSELVIKSLANMEANWEKMLATFTPTISQAFTILEASIGRVVGQMSVNSALGAAFSRFLLFIAQNAQVAVQGLIVLATALGPAILGLGLTYAISGLTKLGGLLAANPFILWTTILVTAAMAAYEFGGAVKLTADGTITLSGAIVGIVQKFWEWLPLLTQSSIAMGLLAFAFTLLIGEYIIAGLASIVSSLAIMYGWIVKIGTVLLTSLLTPWGLISAAIAVAVGAVAYLFGGFEALQKKLEEVVGTVAGELSGAMEKASKSTAGIGLQAEALAGKFADAHKAAVPIAAAGNQATAAFKDTSAVVGQSLLPNLNAASSETAELAGNAYQAAAGFEAAAAAAAKTAAAAAQAASASAGIKTGSGGAGAGAGGNTVDLLVSPVEGNSIWGKMADAIAQGVPPGVAKSTIDRLDDFWHDAIWMGSGGNSNYPSQAEFVEHANWAGATKKKYPGLSPIFSAYGYRQGGDFRVGGSGGPDSQLVNFMATPNERVKVMTPKQQREDSRHENTVRSTPINVSMSVVTKDYDSFRRNQTQTILSLESKVQEILRRIG